MPNLVSSLALLLAFVYSAGKVTADGMEISVPPNVNSSGQIHVSIFSMHHNCPLICSQVIHPLDFNVFNQNSDFRQSSTMQFFNPTNTTPPFFQVFHPKFPSILGPNPSIRSVASNPDFAFMHEAPIWLPKMDEVTFASNTGRPLGMSNISNNNQVPKINLQEVAAAIKQSGPGVSPVNVTVMKVRTIRTLQHASCRDLISTLLYSWVFRILFKSQVGVPDLWMGRFCLSALDGDHCCPLLFSQIPIHPSPLKFSWIISSEGNSTLWMMSKYIQSVKDFLHW